MRVQYFIISLIILTITTTAAYHVLKEDRIQYRKALKYLEQASYRKAIPILDDLAKKGFHEENVLWLLGETYEKAGNTTGSIAVFRRLADKEPTSKWTYLKLAELYERNGEYAQAAGIYNALLKKEPGNRSIKARLARSLTASGNFDGAIEQYRAILGENP